MLPIFYGHHICWFNLEHSDGDEVKARHSIVSRRQGSEHIRHLKLDFQMADAASSLEPLPAMHVAYGLRRRMQKSCATLELQRLADGELRVVVQWLMSDVCICDTKKELLELWGHGLKDHRADEKLLRLAVWFDQMSFARYREPKGFSGKGTCVECGKDGYRSSSFHD